ncbi:hypothetical protein BpHYR1_041410 [Brachionus plicatilis]|uniref:Uncharacterized protein n=1 Tax=Brachionus plicatilis TaxID=10195 RepID=A0A3M7QMD8_BRAPC|nr:hypothetical protein BpHYR1_041410 [Brachionus plicatilis]
MNSKYFYQMYKKNYDAKMGLVGHHIQCLKLFIMRMKKSCSMKQISVLSSPYVYNLTFVTKKGLAMRRCNP